ncbi:MULTISPECIES: DNA recombination protein RmuC [Thermoactinomyces]|jgi:DNA recombination protein RmuC|uniref:DNA recombination protein RmuC n=1 Tax=Thermoactinomyces daqus TaxID=1329516 RepID=A0A7W1X9N0_9BACL|nr:MULTISPECIES: DNA recombination protein RmuC [Thermoactinomyces]MBA4542591.1 DNA recombination protein RmuC [Thermoactinomyces daqus]MBH8598009.1 DNA recombination protein RmuC [Thermoactinomyces sp. CICC 10523]MBH8603040.1 DNA recombination protein RmuC [Thermoactinomyces sp. CICC 10522]MBH8609245.1 DNA recombination protein RmuC [Thermoactinomyces sp. CICC 10521]
MATWIATLSLLLNGIILCLFLFRQHNSAKSDWQQIEEQLRLLLLAQEKTEKTLREEMGYHRQEANHAALENRKELQQSFSLLTKSTLTTIQDVASGQKNLLDSFSRQLRDLTAMNEQKLEQLRNKVEEKLAQIQTENQKKLEEMRQTVDEKLHATLEQRLGESFKLVSDRLERVHKSLGEMQHLAAGVDDLKKVLSNVKSRGVLGEIQLENILEQLLTQDQYEKNAVIKKNSKEHVEFAIKLPAKQEGSPPVLLPIDSKFPLEDYERLLQAQEAGNPELINEAGKQLEQRIKQEAKKISDKYIYPPVTTDFAILFLPLEGLYAEILRRPGLWETVQRQFKVAIVGPTTLSAFLNSLQMGFRTLAIEKHTTEAWRWLGIMKTDLLKFGNYLEKAQRKLDEASKTIGQATKQTETMKKKLDRVENLPSLDSASLSALPDGPGGE